jgi:hypothetical protein
VYFAFGLISGKIFLSDAAARTVGGTGTTPLAVVLAVVAAGDEVELELLLPQPTATADTAIAMTGAEPRRIEDLLI